MFIILSGASHRDGKLVNQSVGARPKSGVLALLG